MRAVYFYLFIICFGCREDNYRYDGCVMIVADQPSIIGISDLNPIHLWLADYPTYNERRIPLLMNQKFYFRYKYDAPYYNRLDIAFSGRRFPNWDAGTSYSIGDTVFDPATFTRWVSNADGNIGNIPNPSGGTWDHYGPLIAWSNATTYNAGDRVIGAGITKRIYESLVDGNLNNLPTVGALWDQVTEPSGFFKLQFLVNGVVVVGIDFDNIRSGSTHQFVTWLWSDYPELLNKRVQTNILDVQNNVVLAWGDCIDVVMFADNYPYTALQYTNSSDYAGVVMEVVNPQYYIPLPAHFYEESQVEEGEDSNLTNGMIAQLRRQMIFKTLLNIIDPLPDYMHTKLRTILMCDNLVIDGVPYKKSPGDAYNNPKIETSRLSYASVQLTRSDNVLINLSRYDASSGGRVFSGEFSGEFS